MRFQARRARLEALLDEPAARARRQRATGLVESGRADGTLRAAVVFGHPHPQYGGTMHTKAVYQAAKALAGSAARAALQLPRRRRERGRFDDGRGEQDDFRAALDFMHDALSGRAALGRRHVVRLVGRR